MRTTSRRSALSSATAAPTTPGRTHDRTHYALTDKGRGALEQWLATPARFARIQNEAIVRVPASEYADRGVLLTGLEALRGEIAELTAALDAAREIEPGLPHRERALRLNQRLPPPERAPPPPRAGDHRRGR